MRLDTIPFTGEEDSLRGGSDVISLSELKAARELAAADDDSDVTLLSASQKTRERRSFDGQSDVVLSPESVAEMREERRQLLKQRMYEACGDAKRAAEGSIRNRDDINIQRYGM